MKNHHCPKLALLILLAAGFLFSGCAHKPLPWSRELDSQALQIYNEGQEFYNQGRYWPAGRRYKKVIKKFSRSRYADNAQFMLGEIQAAKRHYEAAVEQYHKVAQEYPASELVSLVAEKEYAIAEHYWRKNKKKLAISIYTKVVETYPLGELAPKAQIRVADYYYTEKQDYSEAIVQYQRLVDDYPQLPTLAQSVFRLGNSYWKESLLWSLDQKNTDLAVEHLSRMQFEFSPSPYVAQAQEIIRLAIDKKAKKEYKTGYFYYWEGEYEAARLYYDSVLKNYAETSWAGAALYDYGRTYYKEKQYPLALEKFQRVKQEYPQDTKLLDKANRMIEKCTSKLEDQKPN